MSSMQLEHASILQSLPTDAYFQQLGLSLASAGYRGRVQRIDIARSGTLVISLAVAGQQRWLAVEFSAAEAEAPLALDGVRELSASSDEQIPLSRHLTTNETDPGLTVLSYVPFRRLVLLDNRGPQTAVLKGYRKGRAEKSANLHQLAATSSIPGSFYVPKPSRTNTQHDYMAMPFVVGKPFHITAERSEDFEGLGAGLRRLQAIDTSAHELSEHDRHSELDVIDERARRMRLVGCAPPESWASLRQRIWEIEQIVPHSNLFPAHRDLHDGQLMRAPEGIALLDFDLLSLAEPELDPANFLAHLSLRQLQMPHRISDRCVQACGKKFLDGIDAYRRVGFWERLRFYQATTFCRLQLVYSLRPKWAGVVESLGRLGHRCLDDLEHLVA